MGFLCFFPNEAWVGGPNEKKCRPVSGRLLFTKYVQIQQLDKQAY